MSEQYKDLGRTVLVQVGEVLLLAVISVIKIAAAKKAK